MHLAVVLQHPVRQLEHIFDEGGAAKDDIPSRVYFWDKFDELLKDGRVNVAVENLARSVFGSQNGRR